MCLRGACGRDGPRVPGCTGVYRGVPGCPGVSRRGLWPEGRRPLTSCSCLFPHFPAFAVSRTWITGLIRQLPNALNFKHAPVAASTHDLRSIRAGRVRCGAQRQESGADEVPGDAREGARLGMGRCRAGPLAGTPAERRPQTCLRRRRAMAFPARLTRCLRRRRARRLRRCRGSLCGETPADVPVKTQGNGLSGAADKVPAETSGETPAQMSGRACGRRSPRGAILVEGPCGTFSEFNDK